MFIKEERQGLTKLKIALEGRLDAVAVPLLERKVKQWGDEIIELTFDFSEVSYISSMGLRLLLQIYKSLNARNGKLVIKNMTESVREVFEMTGFVNLLLEEEKIVLMEKPDAMGAKTLCLIGQLDGKTTLSLQKELRGLGSDTFEVSLDFEKVSLISASGYNMLLNSLDETVRRQKTVVIRNASPEIQEKLETEIAGFDGILRIVRQGNGEIEFGGRRASA
jgi:anti-sigma B factor antagonist